VTAITRLRLPGGTTALVQRATTHEEAPAHEADAAFVRAEILHGLFLVQPDTALQNRTHFTMVGHYNPGGGVPAWVMNQLAARNPASFIAALSRVAKQFDAVAAQHIGKKGNTLAACADRSFDSEPCPWLVNMNKTALHTGSSSSSSIGTFADVETAARGLCKETNNCSVLLGVLTALIAVCLAAAGTRRRRRKHSSTAAAAAHAQSNGHSTVMMNGSSTGDAASNGSSSSRNSSATSPSASQRRIVELYRSVSVTPPSPPVTAIAAAQDKVQSDATAAAVHNGSE
jgi:START domain